MNIYKIRTLFIIIILALVTFASIDMSEGKGGAKSPPPPPPPCPIQNAGCYKTGDVKAGFGELAPNEFGYFLPENKCQRSGGCDCRGVPDNIAQQTNPDESSGACTCIAGTDWNTKGRCCGKSTDDCGRIRFGVLCSIDANAQSANWIASSTNTGDIRYVGCSRAEYLSDGSTWVKCEGTFWRKTVENSEYICIGQGRESIVECCGDSSCKSKIDGKRLSTGQSANPETFANEQSPLPPPASGSIQISPANPTIGIGQAVELQALYGQLHNLSVVEANWKSDSTNIATVSFKPISCPSSAPKPNAGCLDFQTAVVTGVSAGTAGINAQYILDSGQTVMASTKVIVSSNQATGQVTGITGQVVGIADTKTYYCRPDRTFATDLDVPNSQISDKALIGKDRATCEKAGFTWTGTKCCSEDDDMHEYYNDPNGKGGCFDKKPILSISFVSDDNNIVNFQGSFHSCATQYSDLVDKHTGGPLVTNHDYCFNDPGKNFYCSFKEQWSPTNGADRTHISFAPILNAAQAAECCAADECWDGSSCVANQKDNPLAQPIGNNSRCIDGEWTNSKVVVTIDDNTKGFCPSKSQCLLTVFGTDVQKQCVNSSDYVNDNLCEDGEWTSRTKLLALKLLKLKSGDFTLSCDNRENTLNNLQYLTDSNELVANILTNLQTNNFCILKSGSKIVAATSINKNLEDAPRNSLNIFGVTSCSDEALTDDGQYHSCDAANKVWFNKRLKSFIYSSTPITVPAEQNQFNSFEEFIGSPIKSVIDSIKRLIAQPPFDESYINAIKKFDKLYITQKGSTAIRGSIEGKNIKNAVMEYAGFDTDMCKFIDQFNQAKKDVSSGITCKKEGNNYFVLAQGSQFTNINPESIWPDLTSKLRLK